VLLPLISQWLLKTTAYISGSGMHLSMSSSVLSHGTFVSTRIPIHCTLNRNDKTSASPSKAIKYTYTRLWPDVSISVHLLSRVGYKTMAFNAYRQLQDLGLRKIIKSVCTILMPLWSSRACNLAVHSPPATYHCPSEFYQYRLNRYY